MAKRKGGRPKGAIAITPRKGSLRAHIVEAYDQGGFPSSTALADHLTEKGHPCTAKDVGAALNRWRPDWFDKMRGLEWAEYSTLVHAVTNKREGDTIVQVPGGYRIKRRE